MSDEPVTLELLGRLVGNVQVELIEMRSKMAEFRDQMTVQTATLLRLEAAQNTMAEQLRTMVSQHQRVDPRLLAHDERLRALEEQR